MNPGHKRSWRNDVTSFLLHIHLQHSLHRKCCTSWCSLKHSSCEGPRLGNSSHTVWQHFLLPKKNRRGFLNTHYVDRRFSPPPKCPVHMFPSCPQISAWRTTCNVVTWVMCNRTAPGAGHHPPDSISTTWGQIMWFKIGFAKADTLNKALLSQEEILESLVREYVWGYSQGSSWVEVDSVPSFPGEILQVKLQSCHGRNNSDLGTFNLM